VKKIKAWVSKPAAGVAEFTFLFIMIMSELCVIYLDKHFSRVSDDILGNPRAIRLLAAQYGSWVTENG